MPAAPDEVVFRPLDPAAIEYFRKLAEWWEERQRELDASMGIPERFFRDVR